MRNLSFWIRDQACTPYSGNMEFQLLHHQGNQQIIFYEGRKCSTYKYPFFVGLGGGIKMFPV